LMRNATSVCNASVVMHFCGKRLVSLGRRGPELLVLALLVGAMAPGVSLVLAPALPVSAFFLTLGSFLSARLAPPDTNSH
jgi:ACR3 family arsenite transporter